jgi:hypothetical protein
VTAVCTGVRTTATVTTVCTGVRTTATVTTVCTGVRTAATEENSIAIIIIIIIWVNNRYLGTIIICNGDLCSFSHNNKPLYHHCINIIV